MSQRKIFNVLKETRH